MADIILPYEVWETVLPYLDGISLLALSCVSRKFHSVCQSFLDVRTPGYWKNACLQDVPLGHLHFCSSGLLEENWLAVYKASMLCNTMLTRTLRTLSIPLVRRFIRHKTGVHILGSMVVITQGPVINIFDALTGKHITQQRVGTYNIHHSFIMRKVHAVKSKSKLPCDVLVMLCGGDNISHLAAFSAFSILDTAAICRPFRQPLPPKYMERVQHCFSVDNKVCYEGSFSVEVNVDEAGKIQLSLTTPCQSHIRIRSPQKGTFHLKHGLTVSLQPERIVLAISKESGDHSERVIPVDTALWVKGLTSASLRDWGRIVHVGDDVVPVIATLQTHPIADKHVVLYSFTLY